MFACPCAMAMRLATDIYRPARVTGKVVAGRYPVIMGAHAGTDVMLRAFATSRRRASKPKTRAEVAAVLRASRRCSHLSGLPWTVRFGGANS